MKEIPEEKQLEILKELNEQLSSFDAYTTNMIINYDEESTLILFHPFGQQRQVQVNLSIPIQQVMNGEITIKSLINIAYAES